MKVQIQDQQAVGEDQDQPNRPYNLTPHLSSKEKATFRNTHGDMIASALVAFSVQFLSAIRHLCSQGPTARLASKRSSTVSMTKFTKRTHSAKDLVAQSRENRRLATGVHNMPTATKCVLYTPCNVQRCFIQSQKSRHLFQSPESYIAQPRRTSARSSSAR